jgi:hypothetical protein
MTAIWGRWDSHSLEIGCKARLSQAMIPVVTAGAPVGLHYIVTEMPQPALLQLSVAKKLCRTFLVRAARQLCRLAISV